MPPSRLAIATSSLSRLVKEEKSYRAELESQKAKLTAQNGHADNDNADYMRRQETAAIKETEALFPQLHKLIAEAVSKVESELETEQSKGQDSNVEEITKAKDAIAQAKTSEREIA